MFPPPAKRCMALGTEWPSACLNSVPDRSGRCHVHRREPRTPTADERRRLDVQGFANALRARPELADHLAGASGYAPGGGVYFIFDPGAPDHCGPVLGPPDTARPARIKIGSSTRPRERAKKFGELVRVIPCRMPRALWLEKALHRTFTDARIAAPPSMGGWVRDAAGRCDFTRQREEGDTEWFYAIPELRAVAGVRP